jgi:hypothetical protein
MFGPKRDVRTGEGSTMRNFIICFIHLIRLNESRRLSWASHVVRMEEGRSAFKIITGKPTRKRPSGRTRHSCEDNMKMYVKDIGTIREDGLIQFRIGIIGVPL